MFFGHTCHGALVPALLRPSLHSSLQGVKHFLPVNVDTTSTLGIFPQFNAMDPMHKAMQHPTLGFFPGMKRKHVSCSVCQLRFNSQSQASSHYKGTKHAKKVRAMDSHKCKLRHSPAVAKETLCTTDVGPQSSAPLPSPPVFTPARPTTPPSALPTTLPPVHCTGSVQVTKEDQVPTEHRSPPEVDPEMEKEPGLEAEPETEAEAETEEEKARRLLYCSLCKVAVNSTSQLDAHNSGTKHKTMLEARSGVGCIKSFPRVGVKSQVSVSSKPSSTGLQNKTFHCETCDVHVNSETQLKQHISSRRHKDRAAGKPLKPKYSPYSKAQKGTSKTPVKLLLVKDRPPVTAQMLPSHLAAVAAAIGTSFSHPTGHAPTPSQSHALFQTQPLPPTLLRHAPGPTRSAHPQVLFVPY